MSNPILPRDAFERILENIEQELRDESIELEGEEVDHLGEKLTFALANINIDVEE